MDSEESKRKREKHLRERRSHGLSYRDLQEEFGNFRGGSKSSLHRKMKNKEHADTEDY